MAPAEIKAQQTYRSQNGNLVYVQDIEGKKITWVTVGEVHRYEGSLARFASHMVEETPNG